MLRRVGGGFGGPMPMHWLTRETFAAVVAWLDQAGHVELAAQLQAVVEGVG